MAGRLRPRAIESSYIKTFNSHRLARSAAGAGSCQVGRIGCLVMVVVGVGEKANGNGQTRARRLAEPKAWSRCRRLGPKPDQTGVLVDG